MSIPLDRLYHYIESVAQDVYGDTVIYRFYPHGSKKLTDLSQLSFKSNIEHMIQPEIICNDQEPLSFDLYSDCWTILPENVIKTLSNYEQYLKINLRSGTSLFNIHDKCVLLHSELNSPELVKYHNHGYVVGAYYWNHAFLAIDWYRYAQHIDFDLAKFKYKFLIYNRAWSGTREYRLKLAELLAKNNLINDCQTTVGFTDNHVHYSEHCFNNPIWEPSIKLENFYSANTTPAESSADFNLEDYKNNLFEIVLETLFDDPRIHLTEKTLRPIAIGRPFILCAPAGSLQYLKNYGFKTFSDIFDESYDGITDSYHRLEAIVKLIKEISQWDDSTLREKISLLKKTVQYNKDWFFSKDFFNIINNELHENLKTALTEITTTNTFQKCLNIKNLYLQNREYVLDLSYPEGFKEEISLDDYFNFVTDLEKKRITKY